MRQPTKYKDEKMASLLAKFAAEYLEQESNRESLITVTRAEILNRGRRANIFFTAIPREKEAAVLEFAKRKQNDFRLFIISKKSFGFAPKVEFFVDEGEHNRQRIDELSNEYHQGEKEK